MSRDLTFEELEKHVSQLPPLKLTQLLTRIAEELNAFAIKASSIREHEDTRQRTERLANVDAWLAECDRVAELWEGSFDAAADLRRIRVP